MTEERKKELRKVSLRIQGLIGDSLRIGVDETLSQGKDAPVEFSKEETLLIFKDVKRGMDEFVEIYYLHK